MTHVNVLQITEANYKLFHPEIFSSPWVQVTVRGRYLSKIWLRKLLSVQICLMTRVQIKMWAVVRIQRCFKRFLKRKSQQRESKKKVSIFILSKKMIIATLTLMRKTMMVTEHYQRADTKERWKKHIEGDDYVPSPPSASSLTRSGRAPSKRFYENQSLKSLWCFFSSPREARSGGD